MKPGNEEYKSRIEALTTAFAILGGVLWIGMALYYNVVLGLAGTPFSALGWLFIEAPLVAAIAHCLLFRSARVRQSTIGLGAAIVSGLLATAFLFLNNITRFSGYE